MSTRRTLLAVATSLGAAACEPSELTESSRSETSEAMPAEATLEQEPVEVAMARVMGTVVLAHGGVATFIDMGDGEVAVAERAPREARFVTFPLMQSRSATPLAIYQSLRNGSVAAAPRAAAAPLAEPGYDSYECDHFGFDWVADWKAAFVGVTKYREAIYRHNKPGNYTFYPGAPVYEGTNTNSVTYLGACNGDDDEDLVLEIHRRIGGIWKKVHEVTLSDSEKYTFYSGVPSAYRGRAHGMGDTVIAHYGVGAAWTLSPGRFTPR